jgi:hypothetical protein
VSPMRYELGFYIPEDGVLFSRRRENLKPCIGGSKLKRLKRYSETADCVVIRNLL